MISLLKDEGFRWSSLLEGFKVLMTDLPGEAFISSLFLSYLGPFTGEYRVRLLSRVTAEMKSCKVAFPSQFSLTTALYDQITVREWVL